MNKTITITVSVDGNEVSRSYNSDNIIVESDWELWGSRIEDMLDTLKKSEVKEF